MKKLLVIFFSLLLCPTWAQADWKKIEGTTNVEDAMISSSFPDNNYGDMGNADLTISSSSFILIRAKNIASELGENATISACTLYMYCSYEALGAKTINANRLFKPWVEGDENGVDDDDGDVTWNDWVSDANEWAIAGAVCEGNDGSDNSVDNGDCLTASRDRTTTREDYESVNGTGWFAWGISAELAQDWYDGTANPNGVILKTTSSGSSDWRGTEAVSNQPYWTFTYTTGAAEGVDKPRKNIMSGGIVR